MGSVHRRVPWTRRHDDPRRPLLRSVPRVVYPTSLKELLDLCWDPPRGQRLHAAGSHWSLSRAAISDHTFVETHDPTDQHPALDRTLTDVVPGCLHPDLVERMRSVDFAMNVGTFVHVEAGKRIHQLYAELDTPHDVRDRSSLAVFMADRGADHYRGPWAPATLGGAGGQTIVGALTTGTHGGDHDRGVLADSVAALHLVTTGGHHWWVEPAQHRPLVVGEPELVGQLTDDDALRRVLTSGVLADPRYTFHVMRDDAFFDALLVSCGRFGIIYSVVLRARPAYALWERRRLHLWQDVKAQVHDRAGPLFVDTAVVGGVERTRPRFLQVVVCLTTHLNFQRNLAGVTKRWELGFEEAPSGRAERVGELVASPFADPSLTAPVFSRAGASLPYSPSEDEPLLGEEPGMLDRACANASFLAGILDQVIREIEEFVESDGAAVGAGIAAVAAVGGGGLVLLVPALFAVLVVLRELLEAFGHDDRLGEHMERIKDELLDPAEPDPSRRAAGLFAWQMIAYGVFAEMQKDLEFGARSYAVMDRKNYLDRSCEWNVESVEVFFDATDSRLVAFVDALIAFEMAQELQGKAFLGYASLRFTGPTRATLGMQRWATTCSIEVAGLVDLSGSRELVAYATRLALNPNIGGILHWGQRNTASAEDVERLFGTDVDPGGGPLGAWREQLSRVATRGDAFSNAFTRRTGLEPEG